MLNKFWCVASDWVDSDWTQQLLSTQYWWFKIINNSEFSIKLWASKDDYLCVSFYCKTSIVNITSIISCGVLKKIFQTSIKAIFWINRKIFPSRIDSICNESIFAKFIFLFLLINWLKSNVFKFSLFLRIRWSIISIKLVNTVKPFVQSPLNDRGPSNFERGDWTKGISVLDILIYLLIFFI